MATLKLEDFLNEATKEQAIKDYVLKNKKLSREIIDNYMKSYLSNRVDRVMYSSKATTRAAVLKFNDKVEEVVDLQVTKVLADTKVIDLLLDDTEIDKIIKKKLDNLVRDKFYYEHSIRTGIDAALEERTKKFIEDSGILDKYDTLLQGVIDKMLTEDSLSKDAERIIDTARRLR